MNIGKRIKEARLALEMTQDELAERAGIAGTYVSRIERGERDPSWGMAVRLATALGVELTFDTPVLDERRLRAWRMFETAWSSSAYRSVSPTRLMKMTLKAIDQGQAVLDREPSP